MPTRTNAPNLGISTAIVVMKSLLAGDARASQWCLGKTSEYGRIGAQVQDDSDQAIRIWNLINEHDDFEFSFVIANQINPQNASNDESIIYAKSTIF